MSADRLDAKRPHAKKRTYNTRLIKRDYAYFIPEIADLLKLHRNAVRRWLKSGLPTVDDRRPALVHGGDLIAFLDSRQASRKQKCEANELYCCRCRRPQRPLHNRIKIQIRDRQKLNLSAVCSSCGARMNRVGSVERLHEYQRVFDVQTTPEARISGCSDPTVMCHLEKDGENVELQSQE